VKERRKIGKIAFNLNSKGHRKFLLTGKVKMHMEKHSKTQQDIHVPH
jgi:hypothetical protein